VRAIGPASLFPGLALLFLVVAAVVVASAGPTPGLAPSNAGPARGPGSGLQTPAPSADYPSAALPVVTLLASLNVTPYAWGMSFPLNFTVPAGTDHIVYAWAVGGNYTPYSLPRLPAGLWVNASVSGDGMASGSLAAGSYRTNLSYAGWTNYATVAIYGISGDAGDSYQFFLVNQEMHLTPPPGADVYLALQSTGGTYPVSASSLTTVDDEAAAIYGGYTGLIGRQATNSIWFSTSAGGYAIVAVGIYPPGSGGSPSGPSLTLGPLSPLEYSLLGVGAGLAAGVGGTVLVTRRRVH